MIGADVDTTVARGTVEWLEELGQSQSGVKPAAKKKKGDVPARFSSEFYFGTETLVKEDREPQHSLARAEFELRTNEARLLSWGLRRAMHKKRGAEYFLRLPQTFFEAEFAGYGAYEFRQGKNTNNTIEVAVELRGLLPDAVLASMGMGGSEPVERRLPLPLDIATPFRSLRDSLNGVRYLGPLRSPAERFYVAAGDSPQSLDTSGDFLPYVLRDRGTETIEAPLPGGTSQHMTLVEALNRWIAFLRDGTEDASSTDEEIDVESTRQVLVELELRGAAGEGKYALADSGFGYSQVLPILVRGLLTGDNETLIIEQPELHLHPAVQIRLASFFVELSTSGRQVILETHSEHIVNAIRVATAEDDSNELTKVVRIYYLDSSSWPPSVHDLNVQANGTVPDWPQSFFGEALSLTGRLLRAQRTANPSS